MLISRNNSSASLNQKSNKISFNFDVVQQEQVLHGFQVLKQTIETQDFIIKELKVGDLPKINKHSRSYKDIAEVLAYQNDILKSRVQQSQNRSTGEDNDQTTVNTQHGEELDHLQDIIQQKSQIIDMLSKEKNYYMKKIEQFQQQYSSYNSQGSNSKQHQEDLEVKIDQAMSTVQDQKELIQQQNDYIQDLEEKQKKAKLDVDELLNQINKLESQQHSIKRQELSNMNSNRNHPSQPLPDDKRQWSAQTKLVEELLEENRKLREDQRNILGATPLQNFDPVSCRLETLINDLYLKVVKSSPKDIPLEDQVFEVKTLVDLDKHNPLNNSQRPPPQDEVIQESRFADFVNLNYVQNIYEEYFNQKTPEIQAKHFKDLYNIIEECTSKFHELFIHHNTLQGRNLKYNETFQQLDQVFSQESQGGEDDGLVLQELRKLGNVYLKQIFDLQEEITVLRSLQGMPHDLVAMLKSSYQKKQAKHNSSGGSGVMSLEEQMIGMNERIKEQEMMLRQRERKMSKGKNRMNVSQKAVRSNERQTANVSQQELIQNLNKALDKIYEMEQVNDKLDKEKSLIQLEHQKCKEEQIMIMKEKQKWEQLRGQYENLQDKNNQEMKELQEKVDLLNLKVKELENTVKEKSEKAQKLTDLNEELRDLVSQERQAYSDDQKKSDSEFDQMKKQHETKLKILRSKLLMVVAGEGLDKNHDEITLDDLIKKVQDIFIQSKKVQQSVNLHNPNLNYQNSMSGRDEYWPGQKVFNTSVSYQNMNTGPSIARQRDVSPVNKHNISSNVTSNPKCEESIIDTSTIFKNEPHHNHRYAGYHHDAQFMQPSDSTTPNKHTPYANKNNRDESKRAHVHLKGHSSEKKVIVQDRSQNKVRYDYYMNQPTSVEQPRKSQPPLTNVTNYSSLSGFKEVQNHFSQNRMMMSQNCQNIENNVTQDYCEPTTQQSQNVDNKKSINDILSNFRKEKEQFSEKLVQLRIKLQGARQQDNNTHNTHNTHNGLKSPCDLYKPSESHYAQDISQSKVQQEGKLMSPLVDNRRAKTLQKLKQSNSSIYLIRNQFGQNTGYDEGMRMRPFDLNAHQEKKTLIGDLYEKLNKAQQSTQHQSVLDHTDKILIVDPGQEWALRARLTSLIKLKHFDQGLDLIKGNEKLFYFEKSYIFHRQGKNKEALACIQQINNKEEVKVKHLVAQIQYKLNDYKSSLNIYEELVKKADQDEVPDILTNMLACSSNYPESISAVNSLVENISCEKTYEFFFNMGQVQMKQQLFQESLKSLLLSYKMAKDDGSEASDLSRFKVQELHVLTSFYNELNLIEYNSTMKVNIPKSIIHENLVELNMNAFVETYEIKREFLKELIGSLNWRKLNERIHQQLGTNQNLTADQKKLMEINSIVTLLRSHQFEEARKIWEKVISHNDHQALKGIGSYFYIKQLYMIQQFRDKKYDDALKMIENAKDTYSLFLRSQILLAKKEPVQAIDNLVNNIDKDLIKNDDFVIFLLKLCINNKALSQQNLIISKCLQSKLPQQNKDLLLFISDILLSNNQKPEAFKVLQSLYEVHYHDSKEVQSKYLNILTDVNLSEALKIQQKLPNPLQQDLIDNDEYLMQLIDEGMPEKKKEKKTHNVVQETKGGAEIFIPKKRKNKVKYPKNFDPKNPGPEPDPERWLPKWQRSRYKKYAKKKGLYIKGAQGDAQIDTDVSGGIALSTAHKEVAQEKNKQKRRKK